MSDEVWGWEETGMRAAKGTSVLTARMSWDCTNSSMSWRPVTANCDTTSQREPASRETINKEVLGLGTSATGATLRPR
jgi:hypothetical protein